MSHFVPPVLPAEEADLHKAGALANYWYVACLSSELKSEPLQRTLFGKDIVLFRGQDQRAHALRDRCLHRNASLSAGRVRRGEITCPYHGWRYDERGRVVHIPSLGPKQRGRDDKGEEFVPSDVRCASVYDVVELSGLIYIHLGKGEPRRPPFGTPHYGERGWHNYYMVTDFDNCVTNLVENFLDVPHTTVVHEGWFRQQRVQRVPAKVERIGESVLTTYYDDSDRISGLGRILNPGGHAMIHTDKFFAPNITRVDYQFGGGEEATHFCITSQCSPVAAMKTRVYTSIAYRFRLDKKRLAARALRPLMNWYTKQVIRQDVDIMRIQARGMKGGARFSSTEADILCTDVEAIRSWLREGGDEERRPKDRTSDISFFI